MTIINSILRAIFAYFLILFLIRLMGRKAISQMTFFDFVVGITLGSVTANLALGPQASAVSAASILITLALLAILSGNAHIKSLRANKLLNSEPVVLIEKGKIVDQNLRKSRINISELTSLLREKNIFSMADVEFAIMETDGKLSALPKAAKQPLTPSDLSIPLPYKGLMKDVVIDSQIMQENLQDANQNETWLINQLKAQGVQDIKDIFYAGLDSSGNLYVSIKGKHQEKHGQHGIE